MTNDRRNFLLAGLTGLAASMLASREAHGAPTSKPLAQRATPAVNLDGWKVTISEVSYPPGEMSARHRHPGFVVGYVLEGQYRFAVNDDPPATLEVGQVFFESFDKPGDVHAVSGNASTTSSCRILAMVFTKKDDPVTIPG